MKALILGCGSIGLRHVGHLRKLGLMDIQAADPNAQARDRAKALCGIPVAPNSEEALSRRPDIVLVCTPAATHIPLALKALEAGAHVFVEKPLSTSMEGIEALQERIQSDGRIVQIGYQLRYHPAMKASREMIRSGLLGKILSAHALFGHYLPKWWPGRDYRQSYMTDANLCGGLLMDVSHEIDLLIWFLGKAQEVTAYGAKGSRLEIQGMDVLKILMQMASGALVSLSIDCIQPTYTRGYELIGEDAALRWDCSVGRADTSLGQLQVCFPGETRYQRVPMEGDPRDTYVDELRDFLSSVKSHRPPPVSVTDGVEVLRVAMAIQRAMEGHTSIQV